MIAITESWLKDSDINDVQIEGYNMFYVNRVSKKGGGVALYIDYHLKCKIIEQKSIAVENLMELLTVEITNEIGKNMLISCVYRAPGPCVELFTDKILEMFEKINNKSLILCGDFNIDLGNPTASSEFKNCMKSTDLYPMITKPTRVTTHSATIIDNIFTNVHDKLISGIFMTDVSDHLPVFIIYEKKSYDIVQDDFTTFIRDKSSKAIEAFREALKKQSWDRVYTDNVNTAYEAFMTTLIDLYDKNCKITKVNALIKKNTVNNPWMTNGLKNACKKKNYLYRLFLRSRTKDAEVRYKKYKNKLVGIIRRQKKDYYTTLLDKNKNSTKDTWSIINSVMQKGKIKTKFPNKFTKNNDDICNKTEIVDEFNDYFVNIGPILSQQILDGNTNDGTVPDNVNSVFLEGVQASDILTIVQKCVNKTSNDFTDMNMVLIKQIIDVVIEPFTYICNLSFISGIFPDCMKIAKVIPLFKKGDKSEFSNYRPISLLPQFSKILEKLFAIRLNKFLNEFNILSNSQYGFRPNHSTATAIMELTEEITNAIDKKHYLVSIFVDLQKAFDTLDHKILLHKLYKYGIRGVAHQWVTSYLKNRSQFVEIDNIKSKNCNITCGVPQGSVLGPILFLLYVNDIVSVSQLLRCILFADDTTLFYSGKNIKDVLQIVENEFQKIMKWFNANRLSLNISKTKFMIFCSKKKYVETSLFINGLEIERAHEIKFLGITIDEHLTWKSHIDNIKVKVSQIIGVLHKVKDSLNKNALFLLYNSLIVPYLTYCIEVWGSACKTY